MNKIKIMLVQGVMGGILYALTESFDQSKWLGDNGWYFYGRRSAPDLATKLKGAGLPLNTRWLPASQTAVAAEILDADNVEWTDEARAFVAPLAAAQEASRATDADIEIPAPDGLSYRPYQRAGVKFCLDAFAAGRKGVCVGDEMGLGKTMQAIGVMVVTSPARVFVGCPASLRLNWKREIEKWWPEAGDVHVINGGEAVPASARVIVCNYDKVVGSKKNAKAVRAALDATSFDLVVLDEAHLLKNPKAQRTAFFLGKHDRSGAVTSQGLVHRCERSILLTGTPIQNKVRESETLLRTIGAFGPNGIWAKSSTFLFRYCGAEQVDIGRGRTAWTFDGAERLPELQAKLRSGFMVRRLKAAVATELPPKLRGVVHLACDEAALMADMPEELNVDNFEAAIASLQSEVVGFEAISALRAAIARSKAEGVIEHVQGLLETEKKVIVFAHHQTLLDALTEAFPASIRIDGSVPSGERQALVDAFQNDDAVQVAILSTHAAGVGLTLTAASTVVFGEADWNPAWCVQAEDRAHRIGQDADIVNVQYLVLDGTLDAHVIKTMVRKLDVADRALDRRRDAGEAPLAAPKAEAPQTSAPRDITIKSRMGFEATYTMTEDRKAAVIEALTYLAGCCDGASTRDDAGFNGRDASSPFVQDLVGMAQDGRMSDKQAAWGLKILNTYKNTQITHLSDRLWPEGVAA